MNRPQMYDPNGKIINIFSDDFERLLDQGYTIEQLLHISKNSIPILETSPNIPLTGYPDIDLTTLSQLHITDLKKICNINKYAKQLCQRKDFWLQKIKDEDLYIPSLDSIKNISWLKVYETASNVTNDIDIIYDIDEITRIKGEFKAKDIIAMMEKSNIEVSDQLRDTNKDIKIIDIYYNYKEDKEFYVISIEISRYVDDENQITKKQLYDFLFYSEYYGIIK